MAKIGEHLISARMKSVMKAVEAADKIGISQARLSSYECNVAQPSIDILIRMSAVYGRSIDYLVTGKDAEKQSA